MSDHWRMELNNYAQKQRIAISWQEISTGPKNAPTWIVTVFINGQQYGRAESAVKASARELAAEQALSILWASRR
ncbi:hypothetical protein BD413DRAFT_609235 [Trametes elegans]|nr:hypothetical protein BD413DRAFT_609235 [Trametes elegans]